MKKLSTYLMSLILSVVLVFAVVATAILVVVRTNVTAEKCVKLSEDINIYSSIKGELQKYFGNQYNTTGIPADVYMDAVDEEYIRHITDAYTNALFTSLKSDSVVLLEIPPNKEMETNIEDFFSEYADSNGYKKDEVYNKKVSATKKNAYEVIENYCDVYKYNTIMEHGVLSKASKVYSNLDKLMTVCVGALILLIVLLILGNIKGISGVLYWTGVSALISGIFGTVPFAYLLSDNYFDSFVIKQPQVFRTFTSAMYGLSETCMAVHIAVMSAGVFLIVIYAVVSRLHKKAE